MITEAEYIAYFTNLAKKHKEIAHEVGDRISFFYIPIYAELSEIDNALRKDGKATPLMMLDALEGTFDDGGGARNLQTVEGLFSIYDKATIGEAATIREVQDRCLAVGLQVLARMKVDVRTAEFIKPGAHFSITNVRYTPIAATEPGYYGYNFRYVLTCPFGYTVDSAIWSDK